MEVIQCWWFLMRLHDNTVTLDLPSIHLCCYKALVILPSGPPYLSFCIPQWVMLTLPCLQVHVPSPSLSPSFLSGSVTPLLALSPSFSPLTLLCFWFAASPHRLVVPNKGYSSLDQSPDEKPLVALDTDRWIQTQNLIWEMLHKSCEKEFMPLTFFCCVAVMMILTCLDTLRRDTPLLRWAVMKNTLHWLQQTPVTLSQFLTPLLYFFKFETPR